MKRVDRPVSGGGGLPVEPEESALAASVVWSRSVALASALALVVLGLAWELWLARTGTGTLAIKVLPLVFALPGLWRNRLYTYRWLSLLVWLYFTEGVVRATSDHGTGATLAAIELLLCLLLFAACAAQVRWRLRVARIAEADRRAPAPIMAADQNL